MPWRNSTKLLMEDSVILMEAFFPPPPLTEFRWPETIFKCLNRGAVIIILSIPERDSVSSGEDPAELFRGKKAGLGYFSGLLHPTQASSLFVFTHSLPISDELKEEEEDLQTLRKAYPNTSNVFPHLFSGGERRKKKKTRTLLSIFSPQLCGPTCYLWRFCSLFNHTERQAS